MFICMSVAVAGTIVQSGGRVIGTRRLWPLLLTGLTLIPAWISDHMPGKV